MNCRLQDEVQSMCEGAEAWCAGNRKFWAAAVGQKRTSIVCRTCSRGEATG